MIGSLLQADFEEIIAAKDWDGLRDALSDIPAADIAELITELPEEDDGIIFRMLPRDRAALVFEHLPVDHQQRLIQSLNGAQVQSILNDMTPDDRTRLFEELPAGVTRRLLETLSPEELKKARILLGYPEGTAGRYMTPEYVALPPDIIAREALERIRKTGRGKETLAIIYIVNEEGRLLEDLRLGSLVLADPEMMIGDIEDRPPVYIEATSPGDEVVAAFERYDRVALPVVDKDRRMLGIITADDVLDFAQKRATQEIQKLGGSEALDTSYRETGFFQLARKRGVWLAVLFFGQMLTATAIGHWQGSIEALPMLALFVPLVISSGGNSGSQTTSIIIRSLALQELKLHDMFYVMRREIGTGLLLGTVLGVIGFMRVAAWYWFGWNDFSGHPYRMAFTVWGSLIGVVAFGSVAGAMLPFILRRFKLDPATASAPFVATLVDVSGLVIYFTIASLLLKEVMKLVGP